MRAERRTEHGPIARAARPGDVSAAVAEAGFVADEDLAGAELVAVRAAARWPRTAHRRPIICCNLAMLKLVTRCVIPIAVVLVVFVCVAVFLYVPVTEFLVRYDMSFAKGGSPGEVLEAVDRARGRILQAAAGMAALTSLVVALANHRLSVKGHVTDRYANAIQQLGGRNQAGRAGAVYALEQITRDSPRYHVVVTDVLAVFVRESTRFHRPLVERGQKLRPAPDVQAALTVLGRRDHRRISEEPDALRFADCTLSGANLRRASMQCVRLRRSKLDDASLEGADLTGAEMSKAILTDADLEGASLQMADLKGANLANAKLIDAKLAGAELAAADLKGAHLAGVTGSPTLTGAQLAEVHCKPNQTCDLKTLAVPSDHPCARYERRAWQSKGNPKQAGRIK